MNFRKISFPAPGDCGGVAAMGAKYQPTTKDLKAGERFQKRSLTESKFMKPATPKRPLPQPDANAKPSAKPKRS